MNESDLQEMENELQALTPRQISADTLDRLDVELFGFSLSQSRPTALEEEQLNSYEELKIESELLSLSPRSLEKSFLDQLDHIPAEADLLNTAPAALSNDFLDNLAHKLENIEESSDTSPNVIPFPTSTPQKRGSNLKWYSTAAAVACIGIFSGLTLTQPATPSGPVAQSPQNTALDSGRLQNVSVESTLFQAQNQGVITSHDRNQYRAMEVIEIEKYTLKNSAGKTILVERPVKKVVYVPVEAD